MPSIVLRNSSDQDIGFLLGAGDEPWSTASHRDCVLMSFPAPAKDPLAEFIAKHKHTEFQATVQVSGDQLDIRLQVPSGQHVLVTVSGGYDGTWSVIGVGEGACLCM